MATAYVQTVKEKVLVIGVKPGGEGITLTPEQAEQEAKKRNKKAEELGIKGRYEVVVID